MQARYRPFGQDYHAVDEILAALVRGCIHFTGNPSIYHKPPHSTARGCRQTPRALPDHARLRRGAILSRLKF